jgi:hypothetical protein
MGWFGVGQEAAPQGVPRRSPQSKTSDLDAAGLAQPRGLVVRDVLREPAPGTHSLVPSVMDQRSGMASPIYRVPARGERQCDRN